ncbi:MAG: sulfurtransferase [Saccharospirillum sp.]
MTLQASPILSPNDLAASLKAGKQPRLFDCRFNLTDPRAGEQDFLLGHIPGALYAHLDRDLSGPVLAGVSGRHPLPDKQAWQRRLREWGLDDQQTIVAYDQGNGVFAARFWWLCRWAGLTQVQVLDGGWVQWQAHHGDQVSTTLTTAPAATEYTARFNDSLWLDADALVAEPAATLLDARAIQRYSGETEPLDPRAGHIPGAICADFSKNLDDEGRWLGTEGLRQRYQPVSDAAPLVCYCGSGVSACHTLLALEVAGIPGARLYPGSWSEWITNPNRPIETGIPKEPI